MAEFILVQPLLGPFSRIGTLNPLLGGDMATFSISDGKDTFDCDIAGNVSQKGATVGTWAIDASGNLAITETAGGSSSIPVQFGFNGGNQLELRQGGNVLFNFHEDANVRPELQVDHGTLLVAPDQNNTDFVLQLFGTWSLDNNFDLQFTNAGVTSMIDGLLSDTERSEFSYVFISQGPIARSYELAFTGTWEQNGSGTDVDFLYDNQDGQQPGKITLPPGLTMDPTKNILVYTYNKGTHTGSLELAGSLRVNSNFSLTYILDSQDAAGIKSTRFEIAAQIVQDKVGEANLQLTVQQAGKNTTISVGGVYHGAIAGNQLTVGFSYTRTISGTQVTDSVAFMGSVSNPASDNSFQWQFSLNGKTISIDVTAHIQLSSGTCINAALNVTVNGQQVAITAMFGITTNCKSNAASMPTARPRLTASATHA
jgi:hypothetical protein